MIMKYVTEVDNNNENSTDNNNEFCYLKISIAGVVQECPIVIQLDLKQRPRTCLNFVRLCTGAAAVTVTATTVTSEKATPPAVTHRNKPIPTYRGCEFHRIVDNFMVQSGDFERFDGTGGYSVLDDDGVHGSSNSSNSKVVYFDDEDLTGRHDSAGIVSMANSGRNKNGSQFFITLKNAPHLDGKHVVFGRVVRGMDTVQQMTTVERMMNHRPVALQKIVICDCGTGSGPVDKNKKEKKHSSISKRKSSRKKRKEERPRTKKKKDRKKKRKKYRSQTNKCDNDDDDHDDDTSHSCDSESLSSSSSSSSSSSTTTPKYYHRRHGSSHRERKRKRKSYSDSEEEKLSGYRSSEKKNSRHEKKKKKKKSAYHHSHHKKKKKKVHI